MGGEELYAPSLLVQAVLAALPVVLLRYPRILVAATIATVYLRPNERFAIGFSMPMAMYFALLVVLAFGHSSFDWRDLAGEDRAILAFVLITMGETVLFHREDLSSNFVICFSGVIYYLSITTIMRDRSGNSIAGLTLFVVAGLICVEALYYHFFSMPGGELWKNFHGHGGRLRGFGNWGNSNETSFIACLGLSGMLMAIKGKNTNIFSFIFISFCMFMFTFTVFLTGSRTGLGCIAVILLANVFGVRKMSIRLIIVGVSVIALSFASVVIPDRPDAEGSSRERFDLRYQGVQIVKDHPIFGVGFQKSHEYTGGMALHSVYYQVMAETGIVGGAVFFGYMFLVLRKRFWRFFSKELGMTQGRALDPIDGLVMASLLYFAFGNQLLTTMFFTVMGLQRISGVGADRKLLLDKTTSSAGASLIGSAAIPGQPGNGVDSRP